MKNLPAFLEFFYYDILADENLFSLKKMFSGYGIFYAGKIFAIFIDGELFFRKNNLLDLSEENQFFYFRRW